MRYVALLFWMMTAGSLAADTVVAARNIRPGTVLLPTDIRMINGVVPGAFGSPDLLVGMETKVAIYAGRPVMQVQIGPPAIVERNQLVRLIFSTGGLKIQTEGRALGRGSSGDRIRVLNLASKSSLYGTIQDDGSIQVTH